MHRGRPMWHTGWSGRESQVGAVPSKLVDALLHIDSQAIFGIPVAEVHDALDGFLGILVSLLVKVDCLFLGLGIGRVAIWVLEGLRQVSREVQCATELVRLQVIVETRAGGWNLRSSLNCLDFLDKGGRLAFHGVAERSFPFRLKDLLSREIRSLPLASLCKLEKVGFFLGGTLGRRRSKGGMGCIRHGGHGTRSIEGTWRSLR